jgi:hypothetical protein
MTEPARVALRAAVSPRCILHAAHEEASCVALFPTTPWGGPWSEIHRGSRDALAGRFEVVVELDGVLSSPVSAGQGARLALWCRHPDVLLRLRPTVESGRLGAAAVVLSPSRLALLDARRAGRLALVAARDLVRGQVIGVDDLTVGRGTVGVTAERHGEVIGRRAAYDIARGAPIDLGKIL